MPWPLPKKVQILFQKPNDVFVPSYMMQISHRVDLSNISSSQTAVDHISMPSDLSNIHSFENSNKFAKHSDVSNRSSSREGHRKSSKIFYVQIKKVGFDEDYIQVINTIKTELIQNYPVKLIPVPLFLSTLYFYGIIIFLCVIYKLL
jgi:hypothetical protein